jgi:hypothetical protein
VSAAVPRGAWTPTDPGHLLCPCCSRQLSYGLPPWSTVEVRRSSRRVDRLRRMKDSPGEVGNRQKQVVPYPPEGGWSHMDVRCRRCSTWIEVRALVHRDLDPASPRI